MDGLGHELWKRRGPVRVAKGGRHLAHADGTPFFYLADTAWNGPLLASDADWKIYLADRAAKGFTAIQFIAAAPWAGAYADAEGRTAFAADDPMHINKAFFDRMDTRIEAINAAGLLAVPVLAWAANFGDSGKHNPGQALRTDALEALVRHQIERFAARQVLWMLAGDGKYGGWRSNKWKRIGRRVLGARRGAGEAGSGAAVGMHPMGMSWPYRSYRREKWLDLLGYQSSHSSDPRTMRWLLTGPPARAWRKETRPILNLEPCYEGLHNWATQSPVTNAEVRRAMYASLLNAPTAGVSYGAHGVWSWETEPREPLNHPGTGIARPWREAMNFPGSLDVRRLAGLFTSIDWWRLLPAPELLERRADDPARFISISATPERDLMLAYLPRGGELALTPSAKTILERTMNAEWFDPRTGENVADPRGLVAPDDRDWLLIGCK